MLYRRFKTPIPNHNTAFEMLPAASQTGLAPPTPTLLTPFTFTSVIVGNSLCTLATKRVNEYDN